MSALTTIEVRWKDGFHHRGVAPQPVYDALEALRKAKGEVRPRDLVEEARDPSHPAHPLFTWDDAEAAARWREHEAKEVIRALEVKVITPARPEPVQVRAYLNTGAGAYDHLEAVRKSEAKRVRVMETALRELEAIREKVEALAIVLGDRWPVEPALAGVEESMRRVRR